jgi:hypothetical protein
MLAFNPEGDAVCITPKGFREFSPEGTAVSSQGCKPLEKGQLQNL